jgi:hypothetical protein
MSHFRPPFSRRWRKSSERNALVLFFHVEKTIRRLPRGDRRVPVADALRLSKLDAKDWALWLAIAIGLKKGMNDATRKMAPSPCGHTVVGRPPVRFMTRLHLAHGF